MKLDDINILEIGNTIQLAGAIWADGDDIYLIPLPGAFTEEQREALLGRLMGDDKHPILVLDMGLADWQRFIRQTDRQRQRGAPSQAQHHSPDGPPTEEEVTARKALAFT